jgi:hypothetical protein
MLPMAHLPLLLRPLGIKPAIQLHQVQRHAFLMKPVGHCQQRSGVSQLRIELVVVVRAIIRPVAQATQQRAGVIAHHWPRRPGLHRVTPRSKGRVDTVAECNDSRMQGVGGCLGCGGKKSGTQLAVLQLEVADKKVIGGRHHHGVKLVVEQHPRPLTMQVIERIGSEGGDTIAQRVPVHGDARQTRKLRTLRSRSNRQRHHSLRGIDADCVDLIRFLALKAQAARVAQSVVVRKFPHPARLWQLSRPVDVSLGPGNGIGPVRREICLQRWRSAGLRQ